ncbi:MULTISPECIES: TetR/AcrR family transcriptional regulator [Cytobacillus]|uniref:TetR/AcrR family transcriptional regulator n=1 Tax=Cytobacillus stercorigallinarum TaxID=2762240 RepID=A0ABR8QSG4_9BACI|nr:TetR/AcrR family transcriptional regulator [Cytobacillus stercorigallinarum]MBD7938486.1 TetR/AcrR family transcriptional regulator [Cytobacillus stercorigallinarum]
MPTHHFHDQYISADKIVAVVKELVTDNAYHNITLEEIAMKMRCQVKALTVHFNHMDALLYRIIEEDFNVLTQMIVTIQYGDDNKIDKLNQLLVSFMEFGINLHHRYDLLFAFYTSNDKHSITEIAQKTYYRFEYAVLQLKEQQTEESLVYSAFIALHGFIQHHKGYVKDFEEIRSYAEAHAWFVLKGLS